jgi:YHS domain-containing protein
MPRTLLLSLLAALMLVLAPAPVRAEDEVFTTEAGAIRGYDPVAYHLESRAVPGSAALTHEWNGATWRFASEANRALFAADPARYAPAYGGYCAYGTAHGYKVSTDPEAFAIVDGRLYLNYSRPVQLTWNLDRPGYIRRANENWRTLEHTAHEPPAE